MTQIIYLLRHCKTTGQQPGAPLSAEGREQAHSLVEILSPLKISRIIASPFLRAQQSVQPFAEHAGLELHTDDRLSERVLGADNLPNWKELLCKSFTELDARCGNGETSREAMSRGRAVIEELIGDNSDETFPAALLVSHGNLITLMLQSYSSKFGYNYWEKLAYPTLIGLRFEPGALVPEIETLVP